MKITLRHFAHTSPNTYRGRGQKSKIWSRFSTQSPLSRPRFELKQYISNRPDDWPMSSSNFLKLAPPNPENYGLQPPLPREKRAGKSPITQPWCIVQQCCNMVGGALWSPVGQFQSHLRWRTEPELQVVKSLIRPRAVRFCSYRFVTVIFNFVGAGHQEFCGGGLSIQMMFFTSYRETNK